MSTMSYQRYLNTIVEKKKAERKRNRKAFVNYFRTTDTYKLMAVKHTCKPIIRPLVSVVLYFNNFTSKVKCAFGFHQGTKQDFVKRGVKLPKRREKYYTNCIVCGKRF
ncbi:MAG: hypothetical protein FJ045_02425 [Crenarchaeota archaeon]|nr:hypothetical protein [Thermoproteota archaeon]